MKGKTEVLGLVFGGLSVLLFWVPPIGLAFGATGLIISATQYKLKRRYRKIAIVLCSFGVLLFVGFWGTIWVLSQ
jgi:hypothetical protein